MTDLALAGLIRSLLRSLPREVRTRAIIIPNGPAAEADIRRLSIQQDGYGLAFDGHRIIGPNEPLPALAVRLAEAGVCDVAVPLAGV